MDASENFLFGGIERLYGKAAYTQLMDSHVAIIGLGGVGSWAAESLARTGVGKLTLVDFDDICVTNINRQVQALQSQVGMMKSEALKKRFFDINPEIQVMEIRQAFTEQSSVEILSKDYSVIIDCIDSLNSKCFLIEHCVKKDQRLVVVGGSAGKTNPAQIQINDLAFSEGDRLLHKVRKRLRQKAGFPRDLKRKWKIPTVFSDEIPAYPSEDGGVSRDPEFRPEKPMDCSTGMGSVSFVTGSFGFFAAAEAVQICLGGPGSSSNR